MIVELLKSEIILARSMGRKRDKSCASRGIENLRRDPNHDDEFVNFLGAAAELAACKMFNTYPDFDFELTDSAYDMTLACGLQVDVKATHYPNGCLLVAPWKDNDKKRAEAYMLFVGDPHKSREFRFAGGMLTSEIMVEDRLSDKPTGKLNYVAQQHELDGYEDLVRKFHQKRAA